MNECLNKGYIGTNTSNDRCFQGHCQNIPGSWECDCPADKTWKQTGDNFYRCLGNSQIYPFLIIVKIIQMKD